MDIEFQFDDAHAFAGKLAGAQQVVQREMIAATNRLTLQGVAFAMQATPVRTGHLRRSNAAEPATFGGGVVTGKYGNATPYAPPVEFGRRGFSAGPGKVLRFVVGGQVLYRKSVGPAAARPFIRPSVARLRPLVPVEYGAALQRIIARLDVS